MTQKINNFYIVLSC